MPNAVGGGLCNQFAQGVGGVARRGAIRGMAPSTAATPPLRILRPPLRVPVHRVECRVLGRYPPSRCVCPRCCRLELHIFVPVPCLDGPTVVSSQSPGLQSPCTRCPDRVHAERGHRAPRLPSTAKTFCFMHAPLNHWNKVSAIPNSLFSMTVTDKSCQGAW